MSVIDDIRNGTLGIKNIVAVAGGKGGVGKSTVTVNLAIAFAKRGYKTAVLDADIYGPTIPSFFCIYDRPMMMDGKLQPVEKNGVKIMSLGLVLTGYSVVDWSGSRITEVLKQFITGTNWGEIDIMLIDMPSGTGDMPQAICRSLPLKCAIIVTTTQATAAKTAARTASLFRNMSVYVLGAVTNMSYMICDSCGKKKTVFPGGAESLLKKEAGIDVIAELPFYNGFMEEINPGEVQNIEIDKIASRDFDGLAKKILKVCLL